MRIASILRTATLALSLLAITGAATGVFAAPSQTQSNPYDSPDFVVAPTDIH